MSKINDQIQELQTKLKRIEFLNHILDSAKKYDNTDFKDVKEDVISLLENFVTQTIGGIESSTETANIVKLEGEFTQEDLNVVRSMVNRVKAKGLKSNTPPVNDPYGSTTTPKKQVVEDHDKLSFALENRHLANKKVTVANNKGMQITGEVVGLDAPNVVVRTDTGPTIQVPLGNVSLL